VYTLRTVSPEPDPSPADSNWEARWREGRTPWDLRGITPPLQALADEGFFARLALPPPSGDPAPRHRVVVPGCGRGHDLRVFAALGYRVVGVDVVPQAVREARRLLRLNGVTSDVEVLCRDVLGLESAHHEAYSLAYDYTCFCALPHVLRGTYGRIIAGLLRPGGVLLHLAFPMMPDRDPRTGPPFRILEADMRAAFGPHLTLEQRLPAARSTPERKGFEEWFVWRKPATSAAAPS